MITVKESTMTSPSVIEAPTNRLKGIKFILLGSFSFSTMFLLVKIMSQMNTFILVFYRSIVQIGLCLVDCAKKRVNPFGPDTESVRFYLLLRASFGASAVIAWFFGIQNLPLPDAVTLQFTTPVFAALFAAALVGEELKTLDMIGAVICMIGVALISHPTCVFGSSDASDDMQKINTDSSRVMSAIAVFITVTGAAMAGIAYVCVRKIGDRADAVVMVFYYGIVSVPMAASGSKILIGTWNILGDYKEFSPLDWLLLLLIGIAGYGGQWLTNLGLQHETAATATLVTSTQIVWTFLFEVLFLREKIDSWSLWGTALILGFMLVVGAMKLRESETRSLTDSEEEKMLLLESRVGIEYGAA